MGTKPGRGAARADLTTGFGFFAPEGGAPPSKDLVVMRVIDVIGRRLLHSGRLRADVSLHFDFGVLAHAVLVGVH